MNNQPGYSFLLVLLSSFLVFTMTVAAKEPAGEQPVQLETMLVSAEIDAGTARLLKESGEIMSLEDLLHRVHADYPGRIIEIELEEEDDRYIYELELVDERGKVWELEFDANTGELLQREQEDD